MLSMDQYPVRPETRHPTKRPMMTDADFMRGEPNCSTKTIDTNTVNPSPISFGSPLCAFFSLVSSRSSKRRTVEPGTWGPYHGRGLGAATLGHSA